MVTARYYDYVEHTLIEEREIHTVPQSGTEVFFTKEDLTRMHFLKVVRTIQDFSDGKEIWLIYVM